MMEYVQNSGDESQISFKGIVNTGIFPIENTESKAFQECVATLRHELQATGKTVLPSFFTKEAIDCVVNDVKRILNSDRVFRSNNEHNVFLQDDAESDIKDPKDTVQKSSKHCITYDQIPKSCPLSKVFHSDVLTEFIRLILGKEELYRTADDLGALNIHVYNENDRLGWHFDRGEFAVTLLIQKSEEGGEFQYIPDLRLQGHDVLGKILTTPCDSPTGDESLPPRITVPLKPGTLMLFCGHNSLHRVTPVAGKSPRILAVLSYESKPNVHLNDYTKLKFYGRLSAMDTLPEGI